MGTVVGRIQVMFILTILLSTANVNALARSVHSTSTVDIFPQGEISSNDAWYLDNRITFTQDNADYTVSMLEDDRITFEHARPTNLQSVKMWSQNSPSDSLYVTGEPDSSYSFTRGPVIELTDFATQPFEQYEIIEVDILVAFHIPSALMQDQVRFTMNNGGVYDELVTFVNTQGSIDYMNGTIWSKNITGEADWTWADLQNLVVTLDYVSIGTTDDTQLDVDAVGFSVVVEYPWYGTEWASVESTSVGYEMPITSVIFEDGYFDNMQISSCGLSPVNQGTEGAWTSNTLTSQPGQTFGRIHVDADLDNDFSIEVSQSSDGVNFSEFNPIDNNGLIDSEVVRVRLSSSEACFSSIRLDYNDPTLTIDGRVFGSLDGLVTDYSRWKLFINGQEAAYQLIDQMIPFTVSTPIGEYLQPGVNDLTVKLQAWFNWDSSGTASTTLLEITSLSLSGGFDVQWDEDPVCQVIGPQYFIEDGQGVLVPFLDRCVDDRTNTENLSVMFAIADETLLSATMEQDDIKLVLKAEQHGTTTVSVYVTDEAGNQWEDTFVVYISEVDDKPVMSEFPSIIPVESGVSTTIPFSYSDADSTGITVTTDKSWAVVDLSSSTITVSPPTTSASTPVVVTVCDQTSCVNQTMLLEVLTLAELFIEDIVVDSDQIIAGDIVPVRVYVRNSGNSEAALISVRCQSDGNLVGVKSIPMLQPGDLGVVTCDWRTTVSGSQTISVELDRVNQIPESDETNNIETVVAEVLQQGVDDKSSETIISTTTLWVVTIIVVVLVFVLFSVFAPGKIKKL